MSKKSSRPVPQQADAPVPRQMAEIEAENDKLCTHAGKLQYQIHVLTKDLQRTNDAIMNCNYEAAARQDLDKKQQPKEEVSNV